MKAYPTLYRGVQFRSRLEARWAAFLDLKGDSWHYEPFDFEGWIPDFLVEGSDLPKPHLIEVKPVWKIEHFVYSPAGDKVEKAYLHSGEYQKFSGLMLLGVSPKHAWAYEQGEWDALPYRDFMWDAWKQAGNTVQWKAPA